MKEIRFEEVRDFKALLDIMGNKGWRGYRRFASALKANDFWQYLTRNNRPTGAWKLSKYHDDSGEPFIVAWR